LPRLRFLFAFAVLPAFLFAQHNAGSSNTGSSSAAASSAASAASASHSAPTSTSSASHSTPAPSSSAGSHSSPSASTHSTASESRSPAPAKTSTSNRTSSSASTDQSRRSNTKIDSRTAKRTADVEKSKDTKTAKVDPPEQHRRWIFWRHPNAPKDANLRKKACVKEPCPACPPGETRKNGWCSSPVVSATHFCAADEWWNGTRCTQIGETCPAGQIREGTMCRADCTTHTAGAQHWIMMLRNARQERDDVCRQNPTSRECQEAEAAYDLRIHEYRSFLGGMPTECRTGLPDPAGVI